MKLTLSGKGFDMGRSARAIEPTTFRRESTGSFSLALTVSAAPTRTPTWRR